MKTELSKLISVAKIDAEIDELSNRRESLPEIIRDLEGKLATLLSTQTLKKTEIEVLGKEKAQKEIDIATQKDWIAKREEKVKDIKTNKEYHASLKEVSQSKKTLADLEAAVAQITSRITEGGTYAQEMEKNLTEQKGVLEQEISEARGEMSKIEEAIAFKVKQRDEEERQLKEAILKKYKTIKKRIAPAMAAALQGTCLECNTRIPPQLFIELQKFQQIINCPRCHRILYIEEEQFESSPLP